MGGGGTQLSVSSKAGGLEKGHPLTSEGVCYGVAPFFGLPLALHPEYLVLFARRAGWFIGIRVMCPNHLTCCCLMCCKTGFAPAMSRITSFLILSRLVLFTAFLRHFISQVTSFLSRSFAGDRVWHWYVSVGRKMALMSFALVLVEMLGCSVKGQVGS